MFFIKTQNGAYLRMVLFLTYLLQCLVAREKTKLIQYIVARGKTQISFSTYLIKIQAYVFSPFYRFFFSVFQIFHKLQNSSCSLCMIFLQCDSWCLLLGTINIQQNGGQTLRQNVYQESNTNTDIYLRFCKTDSHNCKPLTQNECR